MSFFLLAIFVFAYLSNPVCGDFPHLSFDFCYFCPIFFTFIWGKKWSALITSVGGKKSYSVI